jgi:hypothetical protein
VVKILTTDTSNDIVEIVQFGNQIYKDPRAYEIFKDMLNITHYNRYSINSVSLTKDLYYYDTEIQVTDGSLLDTPITERNIPGTVIINNERIDYLVKTGNVLSQLRRGSLGTAISELSTVGTKVVGVGFSEIIAYNDTQDKAEFTGTTVTTFIYDGSTSFELPTNAAFGNGVKNNLIITLNKVPVPAADYNLVPAAVGGFVVLTGSVSTSLKDNDVIIIESLVIGALDYVPSKSDREFVSRGTIPEGYGICDQIDVFVGGRRLRKDALEVSDESKGLTGTSILEPEFSVDGATSYIRLTVPVALGTRILVIRKTGKVWYDRAETTASKGITLLDNLNPIAKFIDQKSTELPE